MTFLRLVCLLTLLPLGSSLAGDSTKSEDALPIAATTLSIAGMSMSFATLAAVDERDYPGCVALTAFQKSFQAAGQALSARGGQIPRVDVDFSTCQNFQKKLPPAVIEERIAAVVDSSVAATVTTIQALASKTAASDCRGHASLIGVVSYLEGLSHAVVAELAAPDGKLRFAAARLDFSQCEAAERAAAEAAAAAEAEAPAVSADDVGTRLKKLKSLLDQGLIEQADYDQRKAELLKEL